MFVLKKYKIRHRILDVLYSRIRSSLDDDTMEKTLWADEISKFIKVPAIRVIQEAENLSEKEQVIVDRTGPELTEIKYIITRKGGVAFTDKSHISEGFKEFLDKALKTSQILTLWIGATIAVVTILKNTNRIEKVENRLESQERRLLLLESKPIGTNVNGSSDTFEIKKQKKSLDTLSIK